MAVWQWFKSLSPRTRMIVGAGIMAYAGAGLYFSDAPTEQDREELRNALPKISVVEKKSQ